MPNAASLAGESHRIDPRRYGFGARMPLTATSTSILRQRIAPRPCLPRCSLPLSQSTRAPARCTTSVLLRSMPRFLRDFSRNSDFGNHRKWGFEPGCHLPGSCDRARHFPIRHQPRCRSEPGWQHQCIESSRDTRGGHRPIHDWAGAVSNPIPSGAPALGSPLSLTLASTTATIGGANAEVLFSGLAPGFVGLLQVNIRIPNVAAGNQPLVVTIGRVASNSALINVGVQWNR